MKTRVLFAVAAATTAALIATAGHALAEEIPSMPSNETTSSDGGNRGIHDTRGTQTVDCGGGDVIVYAGPLQIWPPNHKYRDLTITATDASGDMVTVASAGRHDEVAESGEEMNGAGHTPYATDVNPAMDTASGAGSASTEHQIRGERSGRGDGRTYTFEVTATFDNGLKTCDATFTSTVPHDMRDQRPSEPGA